MTVLDLREEEAYTRPLTAQMEWKGFVDSACRGMTKKTNMTDSQVNSHEFKLKRKKRHLVEKISILSF